MRQVRWFGLVALAGATVGWGAVLAGTPSHSANSSHRADPGQFQRGTLNNDAVAEAETFNEFPLLWLGPEFKGYPLTSFLRQKNANQDAVYLIYGTCALSRGDEPSCVPPIEIVTSAPGTVPAPDAVSEDAAGRPRTIRGVISRTLSGSPFIWTGGVTITVHANSEDADAAIANLETVNHWVLGRAAVKPGESLASLAH